MYVTKINVAYKCIEQYMQGFSLKYNHATATQLFATTTN